MMKQMVEEMAELYEKTTQSTTELEMFQPMANKEEEVKIARKNDSVFMYFSAFSVGLILVSAGCITIWTSPVLKRLKSADPTENPLGRPLTTYEISILAGLSPLGSAMGPLFLSRLLDKHGRKATCFCMSIFIFTGFIITAFAKELYLYYLARLILGLSFGCCMGASTIYMTEISEDHNRGKFGALIGLFLPLGNLYGYALGPFLSVSMFSLACTVPVLLNLILMGFFIPESPIYLATKGERLTTLKALSKFRNKSPSGVEFDFREIEIMLNDNQGESVDLMSLIKNRCFRKGIFLSFGVFVFQILSGTPVLLSFLGPIFDQAGIDFSGDLIAILVVSVQIVFYFVASTIVERLGRRPLLLVSVAGSGVSLFSLGVFFYLKSIEFMYLNRILWLPVMGIVVFIIFYSIGLGPIPTILMSELFPSNVRPIAVSINVCFISLSCICVSVAFPIVQEIFGTAVCFWFFASSCLAAFLFIYILVPETKGKTFSQIQKLLTK